MRHPERSDTPVFSATPGESLCTATPPSPSPCKNKEVTERWDRGMTTHRIVVQKAADESAHKPAHSVGHVVEPEVHRDLVLGVMRERYGAPTGGVVGKENADGRRNGKRKIKCTTRVARLTPPKKKQLNQFTPAQDNKCSSSFISHPKRNTNINALAPYGIHDAIYQIMP